MVTQPLAPTPRDLAASAVADLGTILGVWAHPDDEVYLSAGLMRLALENGQRVTCVTATAGEHGTEDPSTWPPTVLGPIRRTELQASLAILGADLIGDIEHHWLDYRDGSCADIKPEIAAHRLGALIDRIEPDTVISFDPGGVTGHPDHKAVADWTRLVVADRPGITRLETVVTRSWIDHFGDAIDISTYFDDGYPIIVDDEIVDLNLTLDDELWTIKDQALRAHATQTGAVIDHLGPDLWRAFSIAESFARPSTTHQE